MGLAAISYDPPETLAAFSQQRGITFPLLSDVGSATIKTYGILNPAAEWAVGPDKDDPAVRAEVLKYVSVVGANARMVGMMTCEPLAKLSGSDEGDDGSLGHKCGSQGVRSGA